MARARQPVVFIASCLMALCIVACGGPTPPSRIEQIAARHDRAAYLVDVGYGTTRAEADLDARRRISEQIESRLISRIAVEVVMNPEEIRHTLHKEIEVSSKFARANLIKVVDADCRGESCRAVAALSRSETVEALVAAYAEPHQAFNTSADAADRARAAVNIFDYTVHDRAARDRFAECASVAQQIRVVSQKAHDPYARDHARFVALVADRIEMLAQTPVTVRLDGIRPDRLRQAIATALPKAFTALGIRAKLGRACARGLSLEPLPTIQCHPSPFGGQVCELTLDARVAFCRQPLQRVSTRLAVIRAEHPDGPAQARDRLFDRTAAYDFAGSMREGIEHVLPID